MALEINGIKYYTISEAATLAGITSKGLAARRDRKVPPEYVKFGRKVYYPQKQFIIWLAESGRSHRPCKVETAPGVRLNEHGDGYVTLDKAMQKVNLGEHLQPSNVKIVRARDRGRNDWTTYVQFDFSDGWNMNRMFMRLTEVEAWFKAIVAESQNRG